jgi:hypothetical protein
MVSCRVLPFTHSLSLLLFVLFLFLFVLFCFSCSSTIGLDGEVSTKNVNGPIK